MSLCKLMQLDFLHHTGRFQDGRELYSNEDLEQGKAYAVDYLQAGIRRDPLDGFSLRRFARWCHEQLALSRP